MAIFVSNILLFVSFSFAFDALYFWLLSGFIDVFRKRLAAPELNEKLSGGGDFF